MYPGIAVARELLAREKDARVTFVGTAAGIESRVVPREGFPLELIRSAGLKGKSLRDWVRGAVLLPLSALDAWRVISRVRPSVVIGVGGYSSGPVVALAAMRGIPTLLMEQNAMPGLTTMIAVQAFVNMSVVLGLLPTKGIPLPLVSNGGSSLLVSLLGIGMLLNISQHEASAT